MKPILIVDDEAPIRALIRLTLERAGYTCDEAATGTEAADKIEANTYDLALLDIMLPGPDGYELLDYLRSVQTPVIFLTAKTAVRTVCVGCTWARMITLPSRSSPPSLWHGWKRCCAAVVKPRVLLLLLMWCWTRLPAG